MQSSRTAWPKYKWTARRHIPEGLNLQQRLVLGDRYSQSSESSLVYEEFLDNFQIGGMGNRLCGGRIHRQADRKTAERS